MFKPKSLEYYKTLTSGGECAVNLSQDEACVALKIHDYGVDDLTEEDKQVHFSLIFKLKDEIWP